jgi:hypothetical protein
MAPTSGYSISAPPRVPYRVRLRMTPPRVRSTSEPTPTTPQGSRPRTIRVFILAIPCAVITIRRSHRAGRWVTQLNKGDVWNFSLRTYDSKTGLYKDQSIGDTPKPYMISVAGKPTRVVGVGCKNGGFYVLNATNRPSRSSYASLHWRTVARCTPARTDPRSTRCRRRPADRLRRRTASPSTRTVWTCPY